MMDEYTFQTSGYRFYGRQLRRQELTEAIRHYGFTECGEMLAFLEYVCDTYPDQSDLTWLREKTDECLKSHDNGSDYFAGLRLLKDELEYALSIINRPV